MPNLTESLSPCSAEKVLVPVSLGFFYRELSAAGGYYWLPAPLGWKLANAGNMKTVENNRNWAELLLHDVYFFRSKDPQIHNNHSCKTTINWFSRTCNESKTTLYSWLYTMILSNLQIHWLYTLFFLLICLFFALKLACFSDYENPPNECAKMTRQINVPKWPAKISCRGNLPDSSTRIIRRIYSPEKSAISTRGLLARNSPSPAQNPQAGPGPPTLPPPTAPPTEQGEGAGSRPDPPTHLNRYFCFHSHFMNGYIFLYDMTHTYSTQSGLKWRYKYSAVGERIIARKGWGAGLLPVPLRGMFCIIRLSQEVSRLAILTRTGYKNIFNIPLYSNEYISA